MFKMQDVFVSRREIDPAGVALATAVWVLPIISAELIWLQFITPLPVFYYLVKPGGGKGVNTLAAALLLTGLTATLLGAATVFFFLATMIPTGYMLAANMTSKKNPVKAGVGALIILLMSWGAWALLYNVSNQANFYRDILTGIDQGLAATSRAILDGSELPADQAELFETAVTRLRNLIPRLMPGLLMITMLNVVFLNMVIGHWLLNRKNRNLSSWPPFAEWRLPEKMVAVVIAAGILLLLPGGLAYDIGLNMILLTATLYFFQGLAVASDLLAKWNISPWLMFLALVFFQVYGMIFLAVLGLADVWADFTKRQALSDNDKSK